MKKLVFCLAIALTAFSVSSFAQQGGGMERMRQMYKDSLQLTDVQIDSLTAVRQSFQPQMAQLRGLGDDDRKAKQADIMAQMRVRYKNFLTDDQITKLEAMQARMRAARMRGGGNNR